MRESFGKKSFYFLIPLLLLLQVSCSHNYVEIEDVKAPLVYIKSSVISVLPLGLGKKSRNQRELYSKYFIVVKGRAITAKSQPYRKRVKVVILGERRPYTLEISAYIEKRVGVSGNGDLTYKPYRFDRKMALKIARKLKKKLNNRREEINVIDDFKVF